MSCHYSPGGPPLSHCLPWTPRLWTPLPLTRPFSRGLDGLGAGQEAAPHLPGAAPGAQGRGHDDPSSQRSAWKGTAVVEVGGEGVGGGGSETDERGVTPAQQRSCRGGGCGCCGRGGCPPPEEPHQNHSFSCQGCLSWTCNEIVFNINKNVLMTGDIQSCMFNLEVNKNIKHQWQMSDVFMLAIKT